MPSPFPGMDPYLEDPAYWRETHWLLISALKVELKNLLPQPYFARIDQRLYYALPDPGIYPDVHVSKRRRPRAEKKGNGSRAAAAVERDPGYRFTVGSEEFREGLIEIRLRADRNRVVALIELLSPSNKRSGSKGRRLYRRKQRETLASPTHLIEVDLLRKGRHTVAAPLEMLEAEGRFDCLVSVSRGENHTEFEVWARTLRDRLPRFGIPLSGNDSDVVVDLQKVFNRAYDDAGFAELIDYRRAPAVALPPADAKWAVSLLREAGLRK